MKTYLFPSKSNPKAPPHVLTVDEDNISNLTCSCPGYTYRGTCIHKKLVNAGQAIPEAAETEDGDTSFDTNDLEH